MIDDYLNRNKFVVLKNLREDSFSTDTLKSMLELEKSDKNRKAILRALDKKIKG